MTRKGFGSRRIAQDIGGAKECSTGEDGKDRRMERKERVWGLLMFQEEAGEEGGGSRKGRDDGEGKRGSRGSREGPRLLCRHLRCTHRLSWVVDLHSDDEADAANRVPVGHVHLKAEHGVRALPALPGRAEHQSQERKGGGQGKGERKMGGGKKEEEQGGEDGEGGKSRGETGGGRREREEKEEEK